MSLLNQAACCAGMHVQACLLTCPPCLPPACRSLFSTWSMGSPQPPPHCQPAAPRWRTCWAATAMQVGLGAGWGLQLSRRLGWLGGTLALPLFSMMGRSTSRLHSLAALPVRLTPVPLGWGCLPLPAASAAAGKPLQDGGLDVLYCSHRDGSLSVWQRHPRLLTYSCLGASKLTPSAPKFGSGALPAAGLWPASQFVLLSGDVMHASAISAQASFVYSGQCSVPGGSSGTWGSMPALAVSLCLANLLSCILATRVPALQPQRCWH